MRCVSTSTPAKVNSSHVQQRPGRTCVNQTGDGSVFITNHQEPLGINSTAGGKPHEWKKHSQLGSDISAVTQKM